MASQDLANHVLMGKGIVLEMAMVRVLIVLVDREQYGISPPARDAVLFASAHLTTYVGQQSWLRHFIHPLLSHSGSRLVS